MGQTKGTVKRLDTQYFSTAITELSSAITALDTALANISQHTSTLQSCWEGKAAGKFNSAYNRLKKEFDDQEEVLTKIRDDLQTILESYENWDSTIKGEISGDNQS